jgi:hypothetical protein
MYVIQDKRITTKHAQQLSYFVTGPSNPEVIHYDTNKLSVDVNEQVYVLISSKRSVSLFFSFFFLFLFDFKGSHCRSSR